MKINSKRNLFLFPLLLILAFGYVYPVVDEYIKDSNTLTASLIMTEVSSGNELLDLNFMITNLLKETRYLNTKDPVVVYLLAQRKKALFEELKANPKAISTLGFSSEYLQILQKAGYIDIEKNVTNLAGNLDVNVSDEHDSGNKNEEYTFYLTTSNKQKYRIYPSNEIALVSNSSVEVSGTQLGTDIIGNIKLVKSGELDIPVEPINQTPQPYDIGVFLLTPSEVAPILSKKEVEDNIFSGQTQKFVKENSYNRRYLKGDVHGWITSSVSTNLCGFQNSSVPESLFSDTAVLNYITANNIDLGIYKHIVFIRNCPDLDGDPYNNTGGFSSIGSKKVTVDGKLFTFSVASIKVGPGIFSQYYVQTEFTPSLTQTFPWTNFDFVVIHELGHSFGLFHAKGLDCGSQSILPFGCLYLDYGNHFDAMGSGYGYATHFNGPNKEILGWIKPYEVLNITKSGTYTIGTLETLGGYKFARITNPSSTNPNLIYYNVENRKAFGFDSALGLYPYLQPNQNGLFVSRFEVVANHLIDATPSAKDWLKDIEDAALAGTKFFHDVPRGIKIGPIINTTKTSTTFNVTIDPI